MVGRSEGEYSRAEDQESIWSDETSEASEEDRSREVVACAEAASEGGNDDMGGEEVNRELNRVQYMNYLISEGQFEQAAELAETPSERERVVRAEAEYQEECRQTWLRYHTATGEYETALDLVVTDEEVRALNESMESHRLEHLNYHMERQDYANALELAATEAEYTDIIHFGGRAGVMRVAKILQAAGLIADGGVPV